VRGKWDHFRLEQVLTNLITNAIKYGGRKEDIHVKVSAANGRARLVVRDRGIGIAREDQARIFHLFERASTARNFGGLGLGLFIAREIVDAHGGTLTVESQPDRGSTFVVQLSCFEPAEPMPRAESA
jgi:signal transduction histidine kinase